MSEKRKVDSYLKRLIKKRRLMTKIKYISDTDEGNEIVNILQLFADFISSRYDLQTEENLLSIF